MKKLAVVLLVIFMSAPGLLSQDKEGVAKKVLAAYETFNTHKIESIREFATEDFVDHTPFPGQQPGVQGLMDAFTLYFKAYPDIKYGIKDIIVNDELTKAVVLFRMTGTNTGDFMGMPATNKKIDIMGIDWLVIRGDKASEHWGYYDSETMMKQLGLMK